MDSKSTVEALSGADLLTRTRELAQQSRSIEAELVTHLGEIVNRKLNLDFAVPPICGEETFELEFAVSPAFREKLREVQSLLGFGDSEEEIATLLEMALDALIENETRPSRRELSALGSHGSEDQ